MKALVLVTAIGLSGCASQPMVALRHNLGLDPLYADAPETRENPDFKPIAPTPEPVAPVGQITFTPKHPIQPTAKGMDLVDGAIVCPSLDEATWLYGQINMARHARLSLSPELRRQAELVNGYDEGAEPRPSDYRCQFVKEGTPMNVRMEMGVIPVVWGTMTDGRPFAGVTIPTMIDR